MKILKLIIKPFSLLSKYEKWFVLAYSFALILGIWHALPNFNVVGDEWPYVVGVLQAFQAHTIIPNITYPYTLSWYLNYLLQIPYLSIFLVFFHGSISSLEHFIIYHQEIVYYVPRFITILASLYLISVFFLLARRESLSERHKWVIASLIFTNILFVSLSHTGKMWILSLLLFVSSFYFLDKTLRSNSVFLERLPWYQNPLFYAVTFPFLALSNFAFNIIALIHIIVLLIIYYKDKILLYKIIRFGVFGFFIFITSLLLNIHGWFNQGSLFPVVQGNHIFDGLKFLILYTLYAFPFLVLLLVSSLYKMRHINIRIKILAIELFAYGLLILVVAPWAGIWPEIYLRYLLYPGFIISLMLLYTNIKIWRTSYVLVFLSILFFLKTIFLLMIPTTYNLGRTYLINNASNSLVINNLFEINLPKNQASYRMTDAKECETKCKYILEHPADKPEAGLLVIDAKTNKDILNKLAYSSAYITSDTPLDSLKPVFVSSNSLSNGRYISMEYGLGEYSLNFVKIGRLGQPIYVYYDIKTP